MKKLFAVVLVFMLVLCGCGKEPVSSSSGIVSSNFSSSLPQSTDNETILTRLPEENELSKWNTQNATNVMRCNPCLYDNETLYYSGSYYAGGTDYEEALFVEKNHDTQIILNKWAGCIYLSGNKIYYSTSDEKIYGINTDGTEQKIIADNNGKNIVVFCDEILYVSYDDWKIHKISSNGTDTVLDTRYNVLQYMIYNGKIFYGAFKDERSDIFDLRCFDPQTKEDLLVVKEIMSFIVAYDKLYVVDSEWVLQEYNYELKLIKEISNNVYEAIYPYEDAIYYFVEDSDKKRLERYDYRNKISKTVLTMQEMGYLCGPYIYSNMYEGGTSIFLWNK